MMKFKSVLIPSLCFVIAVIVLYGRIFIPHDVSSLSDITPSLEMRSTDVITIHYHERPPYYETGPLGVYGLCSDPAKLAFKKDSLTKAVEIDSSLVFSSKDCDRVCFGCLKVIGVRKIVEPKNRKGSVKQIDEGEPESLRFECPDCSNIFCSDCDDFLHATLHNCPGCLCML